MHAIFRHRLAVFSLIALLTVLGQTGILFALEVPPLKGRVNDYAQMLSDSTVRQLEGSLQSFENEQSTQIVVLTIPSLDGEVLEEFSIRVAEQWRVGHEGLDNGAILLISRKDRKLRIEVGYGLEGSLTDLVSGRIIRNVIVPRFKSGNFDLGVIDGVSAMMAAVNGEFSAADTPARKSEGSDPVGFFIMLVFILFFIGKVFGRKKRLAAIAGGAVSPVFGFFVFGAKWLIIAFLIPVGIVGALVTSVFAALERSSRLGGHRSRSSHTWGGGFGGGGFGGGGFSGGGGGFGGGGASGGW